jgi:hypothetical protein
MNLKGFLKPDWYLVGLFPLAFGILSYILAIANHAEGWGLLSACNVTAVLLGVALLTRTRFAISGIMFWIHAPLSFLLAQPSLSFQLQHFHHLVSVAILFVILYHVREIWITKGILFGPTTFLAFVIITNYLSGGTVNNPGGGSRVPTMPPMPPIWIGILFAILSALIFLWHRPGFNRARNPKSPHLTHHSSSFD